METSLKIETARGPSASGAIPKWGVAPGLEMTGKIFSRRASSGFPEDALTLGRIRRDGGAQGDVLERSDPHLQGVAQSMNLGSLMAVSTRVS